MNAAEAQELVFTEICKVLEMTTAPVRYQFDDLERIQREGGVV
jgi:hypothetical protein